jgi:hypothetical protein
MLNLENDAITIRLARPIPSDQDSITNFCEHDASDPRTHYQLSMSLIATALGTEVPARETRQALTASTRLCVVAFPWRRASDANQEVARSSLQWRVAERLRRATDTNQTSVRSSQCKAALPPKHSSVCGRCSSSRLRDDSLDVPGLSTVMSHDHLGGVGR